MRTLWLLAILALTGPALAGSATAIDCWCVVDVIAHAEVGADVVALGGAVSGMSIHNGSADTIMYIAFAAVADAVALTTFYPLAAGGTLTSVAASAESSNLSNLYIAWADSAGVGDTAYIMCWGRKY